MNMIISIVLPPCLTSSSPSSSTLSASFSSLCPCPCPCLCQSEQSLSCHCLDLSRLWIEGVWGSNFQAPGRVEDKAPVLLDLVNNNGNNDDDNKKQEFLTWSNLLDIPTKKEFVGSPSHSKGSSGSVSRVALSHFSPTSFKRGINNENLRKQHCRRSPIRDAMEITKASTIWECHL